MTDENKKQELLLETTDCLEAIGTLKSAKNLCFFAVFIAMLVLQGIFWLVPTDYVVKAENQLPIAKTVAATEKAAVDIKIETADEQIVDAAKNLIAEANVISDANAVAAEKSKPVRAAVNLKINYANLAFTIKICNYLLGVFAVLYSLMLMFAMKVSLVGRLGGISHITKAVLLSMLLVVLVLPWQKLFGGYLCGVIYSPSKLLNDWQGYQQMSVGGVWQMFLRYCGLPLAAVLLLLWTQLKTIRWSRNTLKRLGIVG